MKKIIILTITLLSFVNLYADNDNTGAVAMATSMEIQSLKKSSVGEGYYNCIPTSSSIKDLENGKFNSQEFNKNALSAHTNIQIEKSLFSKNYNNPNPFGEVNSQPKIMSNNHGLFAININNQTYICK